MDRWILQVNRCFLFRGQCGKPLLLLDSAGPGRGYFPEKGTGNTQLHSSGNRGPAFKAVAALRYGRNASAESAMRIYLAEQNPAIAEALARELKKSKLGCEVGTLAAMTDLLHQSRGSFEDFDAVILGGAEGGCEAVTAQVAALR